MEHTCNDSPVKFLSAENMEVHAHFVICEVLSPLALLRSVNGGE